MLTENNCRTPETGSKQQTTKRHFRFPGHAWLIFAALLAGCGGSNSDQGGTTPPPVAQADFSISAPTSLTVTPNSTQSIAISVVPKNGFASQVSVTLSGLPAGVTASPATFSLNPTVSGQHVSASLVTRDTAPGASQTVVITANASVIAGPISLTISATSGSITHVDSLATGESDFALTAGSTPATLTAGSTAEISVSADAFNGFSDTVAVTLAGLPAGVTATPSTLSLTPGTPQSFTLTAASTVAGGTAALTLQGTSGSLAHNLDLTLTLTLAAAPPPPPPADFSLSLTPGTLTLAAGGSAGQASLSATAINGFTGPIAVTMSGLPSGIVAMPSSFTLNPGTAQPISFTAASTAAGGTSALTLAATSGTITHSAQLSLTVQPTAPDFSLTVNPASVTISIGGAAQNVSVVANATGTFNSPVTVALTGLPAGVTATPSTLTLTPGSAQTVSLQASGTATAGIIPLTLQGTSGALSHGASLALTVTAATPDFQLFAGPSTLNLSTSATEPFTIALIPLNGFNGAATVTISGLPARVVMLNTPLPLIANIPQRIDLDPAADPSGLPASPGESTITITATAAGITHTAQMNLVISTQAKDFVPYISTGSGLLLTPGTTTFTIMGGGTSSLQLSGLVPGTGLDQTQYTFSATNTSAAFNLTTSTSAVGERGVLKAVFTGSNITHEIDLPIYVVAQPTVLYYVAPISLRPGTSANLLIEAATTNNDGAQLYVGPGWPQDFLLNSGSAVGDSNEYYSPVGINNVSAGENTPEGSYNLPVQLAAGNLVQSVAIPVQVVSGDFALSAEPTIIALAAGGSNTVTVSATAPGGLSSPINVTLDSLPPGVQASPQTFTLQPGDSQAVSLTAGSGYAGGGAIDVDARAGVVAHSQTIAVSPGSFTGDLVATGTTFSGIGTATIYNSGTFYAITADDGYTTALAPYQEGQGQLSNAASNCAGVTNNSQCTPVNVLFTSDAIEPTNFAADRKGTLMLQADFGGGVQLAPLPYDQVYPDFTLNISPANLTIPAGGSQNITITDSPTLTLAQYCPITLGPGNFATISAPPPIGPISSDDANVDLCESGVTTISVPAGVPPGNYELTVNASVYGHYQPNYTPENPNAQPSVDFQMAHTFGVPLTVTAAPTPSFQIAADPSNITLAPGQSIQLTVSAAGNNGFTGAISVTAGNLFPTGVTVSPANFTLSPGSSQQVTVSVATGAAVATDQLDFVGTSGTLTGSAPVSLSVVNQ